MKRSRLADQPPFLEPWSGRDSGHPIEPCQVNTEEFYERLELCEDADGVDNLAGFYDALDAYANYFAQQKAPIPEVVESSGFESLGFESVPPKAKPVNPEEALFLPLPRWVYSRLYWLLSVYVDESEDGKAWFQEWDADRRDRREPALPREPSRDWYNDLSRYDEPAVLPTRLSRFGRTRFFDELDDFEQLFRVHGCLSGFTEALRLYEEYHKQQDRWVTSVDPFETRFLPMPFWLVDVCHRLFHAVLTETKSGKQYLIRWQDAQRHHDRWEMVNLLKGTKAEARLRLAYLEALPSAEKADPKIRAEIREARFRVVTASHQANKIETDEAWERTAHPRGHLQDQNVLTHAASKLLGVGPGPERYERPSAAAVKASFEHVQREVKAGRTAQFYGGALGKIRARKMRQKEAELRGAEPAKKVT